MIQDLVDSVHLESGTVQLAKEPLALRPAVSAFLEVAKGALETDRVDVDVDVALPPVAADPSRIARVVQNLLANALKYSAPGTPVAIRAWRVDGEVILAVSDRGAGIPPEDLPRVFERFYRGSQARSVGGLGLGLYISRLIVEAHGGRIWCESKMGEGSTFALALPLWESTI
jgi:signal transduction histidine kinase